MSDKTNYLYEWEIHAQPTPSEVKELGSRLSSILSILYDSGVKTQVYDHKNKKFLCTSNPVVKFLPQSVFDGVEAFEFSDVEDSRSDTFYFPLSVGLESFYSADTPSDIGIRAFLLSAKFILDDKMDLFINDSVEERFNEAFSLVYDAASKGLNKGSSSSLILQKNDSLWSFLNKM